MTLDKLIEYEQWLARAACLHCSGHDRVSTLVAEVRQLQAEARQLQAEVRGLRDERDALRLRLELKETWATRWKKAVRLYKMFIDYRWIDRCVELKTEAITMERDALRQRVAELEAMAQPDCCDDPAGKLRPGLRVRATSVPAGRMENG